MKHLNKFKDFSKMMKKFETEVKEHSFPEEFLQFALDLISDKQLRGKFLSYVNLAEIEKLITEIKSKKINSKEKWLLFVYIIKVKENNLEISTNVYQIIEHSNIEKKKIDIIDAFFEMIKRKNNTLNDAFNLMVKVNSIERSGWILSNVPSLHKESIGEHMYSMYLMGSLFLPSNYDALNYSKEKVLKMVLLHDLGETITGDIPHPNKNHLDEDYENLQMQSLICQLLYNGVKDAKLLYELWIDWKERITINASIAHDLDIVQLYYELLLYETTYPSTFSCNELNKWMKRIPQTNIGVEIYRKVILENDKFKKILQELKVSSF